MKRLAKKTIRAALERAGYWFTDRSVLPFGVDYLWDIQRMAAVHEIRLRCAFDIGAHGGETATEFLGAFPDAQIHSFEPHPNAYSILRRIKSDRLHAHRFAMSNKTGPAEFFVYSQPVEDAAVGDALPSQNNSLVARRQFGLVTGQYTQTIKVECQTVDQFCADHEIETLDLLKIDTEGHEAEVLDGARETLLRRSVHFVFAEFETILPVTDATGGALAPVAERLEPLGFRLIATYPINLLHQPLYAAFNALYFASMPSRGDSISATDEPLS
jgi:FkbM family methyltransferase